MKHEKGKNQSGLFISGGKSEGKCNYRSFVHPAFQHLLSRKSTLTHTHSSTTSHGKDIKILQQKYLQPKSNKICLPNLNWRRNFCCKRIILIMHKNEFMYVLWLFVCPWFESITQPIFLSLSPLFSLLNQKISIWTRTPTSPTTVFCPLYSPLTIPATIVPP